ncbi:acetyltransferase [Halalkalibacter flavus]|uniref:acetyltransferase n=1 Tax=Halalkalibacter flavus TaxID=3090668 RepID=UPI002FC68CEF
MNNNLLIIGAGGHGQVVQDIASAMNQFEKIDFLDDNSSLAIGKCDNFNEYINEYSYAFVAIGNNEQRKVWSSRLIAAGFKLPVLIHPTSYKSPLAKVGIGSVICAKAVINTNAIIENGCIISIGALVDHDSLISEYSHINSGAIIKAGCIVENLKKVEAGMVFTNKRELEEHKLEVGV